MAGADGIGQKGGQTWGCAALVMAVLILGVVWALAEPITAVFNHEENTALTAYAVTGLRLYFIGFCLRALIL